MGVRLRVLVADAAPFDDVGRGRNPQRAKGRLSNGVNGE
jgi:hypothetical protein